MSEEALIQVLGQYGKVKGPRHVTYRDRPDIRTGTRVVKLEMSKPVPNFIHVQGHRVMVDYCGKPGCTVPCLQCGYGHATTACTQQKSYAAVRPRDDQPRGLQPPRVPEARENPERLVVEFDPSIHHLAQTHSPALSPARTHLRPQASRPSRQSQPPPTALKTLTSSTPTQDGSSSSREMAT
ncbi:hypothetical protein HPB47_006589 [Ixodes persulcatus]|uniref:Uncharacterized protein n=1 Tax=Ixodes persulcatus TaxID=34615 RepID=A0AC60PAT3_IXOPE|nr:hypothetical protein HPB47_006589 [Ixodes persulcatus]